MEARGEIRGSRCVAGFTGEQFALPEAIRQLRAIRRKKTQGTVVTVSGSDPLNLAGLLTLGQRVSSLPSNQLTYRDGVPTAFENEKRPLTVIESEDSGRAVVGVL